MKILLDTNIIIHRETIRPVNREIGRLFRWLDELHHKKCAHPITTREIAKLRDKAARKAMEVKLESHHVLRTIAPMISEVQ